MFCNSLGSISMESPNKKSSDKFSAIYLLLRMSRCLTDLLTFCSFFLLLLSESCLEVFSFDSSSEFYPILTSSLSSPSVSFFLIFVIWACAAWAASYSCLFRRLSSAYSLNIFCSWASFSFRAFSAIDASIREFIASLYSTSAKILAFFMAYICPEMSALLDLVSPVEKSFLLSASLSSSSYYLSLLLTDWSSPFVFEIMVSTFDRPNFF